LSPPGFRLFSPPFRGAFQLSLTVLVRYRSRDVFSLGGWCPPTSRTKSKVRYSGPGRSPPGLRLRGFHPLWRAIPGHFGFAREGSTWPGPKHHIPLSFRPGVWFGLLPFRSPLLGESHIGFFSSPYLDVSFRGVPAPCRERPDEPKPIRAGGPIRVSPDPRLHTATRGLSQPATPFLGARAEPSTRRVGVPGLLRRPHLGCCPRPLRGGHSERELGWAHAPFALHPTSQMLGGCIQPRP